MLMPPRAAPLTLLIMPCRLRATRLPMHALPLHYYCHAAMLPMAHARRYVAFTPRHDAACFRAAAASFFLLLMRHCR